MSSPSDTPKRGKKVRVRFRGPLGSHLPPVLSLLLDYYYAQAQEKGLCHLSYTQEGPLPLSLNHQKKRIMLFRGGKRYPSEALKPEVHVYREAAAKALESKKALWKPTGVTIAVVLFESPHWLTKAFTVRVADCDNLIKPALDAVARATGVPDELHWQCHAFKAHSKRTRTVVWLFDASDLIDSYG